jgi:hypothetical protein
MTLKEKVRDKVAGHLETLLADPTDPDTFKHVLEALTRMAILGTLPPGSGPRDWTYKSGSKSAADEDFSEKKESFIAP